MPRMHKADYLVPSYYKNFVCKCGDCRHVCCQGWDVALPMNEYFRLLGLECTPEIRRKLDCAMRMVDNPRPERYAVFAKGWDGGCPLHDEDGLCMLQKNMGEEVLPWICRLYPRRHSEMYENECSCSGGCENTLELLWADDEKLTFDRLPLEFSVDDEKAGNELVGEYYNTIRSMCFDIMSDRSSSVSLRILRLCDFVKAVSSAYTAKDKAALDSIVNNGIGAFGIPEANKDEAAALDVLELIVTHFINLSPNLAEYGDDALKRVGLDGEGITEENLLLYRKSSEAFDKCFPKNEIYFEKLLVNHIFHEGFPFSDRFENMRHACTALCAAYALTRFIAVCCTDEGSSDNTLADVVAAVFRMIESSAFGVRLVILLNKAQMDSDNYINAIVTLY